MNYEKCSGQSVNFQKSGVFFSSNVAEAKRREISQILGVHVDIKNTKYLGLPLLVRRSKKRVFQYLRRRKVRELQDGRINRCHKLVKQF